MNAPTSLRRRALLSGLALATAAAAVAQVEPIVPPARRTQGLEAARRLLAPVNPPPAAPNPFYSAAFDEALAGAPASASPADTGATPAAGPVAPAGPKGARDLLAAIAQSLKPGGFIVMGGVPSLSFGQKRVKPGGLLTVTFEGNEYTLEVVAIDRTNFTLRLNREEFTRPIK